MQDIILLVQFVGTVSAVLVRELGFRTLDDVAFFAFLHPVTVHLLQGGLNLAFEISVLPKVDIREGAILDPGAFITEPAHPQESLVTGDLVLE